MIARLIFATLCLLPFSNAGAALLNFSLTDGTNNISFQLDQDPTPDQTFVSPDPNVGESFRFFDVPVLHNGVTETPDVRFYASFEGGAIQIFLPDLLFQTGAQLFTGSINAPHFFLGTFQLVDWPGTNTHNSDFSLTIAVASSVPAPATLALLGIALIGLGLRRRSA